MRVRKIAKQLKRWFDESSRYDEPIIGYKVSAVDDKVRHMLHMTRKHYFGLRSKYPVGSMMWKYYTHKACSYELYDEIMDYWGINQF